MDISRIPENKNIDDYPEDETFELVDNFPKFLLDPFEVVFSSDPRYKNALTKEEVQRLTAQ
ncbi:hypothetical protein [uncultured Ruminococcus sp.]|uniref:hypothetical protein n=1 Tax=uncultured Ruminococcus sp. TaxID=165186 RepID=UPI0025F87CAF|nr:hypothetical protein [uncultured Ruminococcus sp.]